MVKSRHLRAQSKEFRTNRVDMQGAMAILAPDSDIQIGFFMNILLLGGGGREHALAWKIAQSPLCEKLFIAPGNAGTAAVGENLPFASTDFPRIREACLTYGIDLVVPGPEDTLVAGVVDFFREDAELSHIPVAGPSASGARLEGSKSFAKQFMARNGIPTASYREFTKADIPEGKQYLSGHPLPIVLKADGLAAGKGVIICQDRAEAIREFEEMLLADKFGEAGSRVVVEAFLAGIELSVFALTDGRSFVLLPEAKDYKRIGVGDSGLNTGGMGAVSPVPFCDDAFMRKVTDRIVRPTIEGIVTEELDYRGFVFFGLIRVGEDPYVIEYNCRLGDPETEAILPRMKGDLVPLLEAAARGHLEEQSLDTDTRAAVTTILVSGGYPEKYEKGKKITGLDQAAEQCLVFHAGTEARDGEVVTSGGRVLAVTALAGDLKSAKRISVLGADGVGFEGKYYRTDIGWEFF